MLKKIAVILIVAVVMGAAVWLYLDLRRIAERLSSYDTLILSKTQQIDKQAEENSRLSKEMGLIKKECDEKLEEMRRQNEALRSAVGDMEAKYALLKDSTVMQVKEFSDITRGLEGKTKDWMKESLTTMNAIETELFAQRQDLEILNVSRLPQIEEMIKKGSQETQQLRTVLQPEALRTLYDRMVRVEEKLNEMQDKVVDVILKQ